MNGFEVVKILLLFLIALEVYTLTFSEKEKKEETPSTRRDIVGKFKDPLGYRTNTRGQYVPIKPNSKMLDGSEDDEI